MSDNIIFIDFGTFSIYWYGVFMGLAVFLSALVFSLSRKMQNESFSASMICSLVSMPAALVTGRVFYCWFGKASFGGGLTDCINLAAGGYALYGALFGVLLVITAFSAASKKSVLQTLDAAVPAISLAITIGRFASILSSSDIGFSVSSSWFQKLPFSVWSESEQSWILWVGFFEGIIALITFVFTTIIFFLKYKKATKGMQNGDITLLFMIMYGLSQTLLESMRNDSLFMVTLGFVRISQIISIVLAIAAIVIIIVKGCRLRKPNILNIILWIFYVAALSVAVYCEFEMNAVIMVRNYIMMGVSLSIMLVISLILFFNNVRTYAATYNEADKDDKTANFKPATDYKTVEKSNRFNRKSVPTPILADNTFSDNYTNENPTLSFDDKILNSNIGVSLTFDDNNLKENPRQNPQRTAPANQPLQIPQQNPQRSSQNRFNSRSKNQ